MAVLVRIVNAFYAALFLVAAIIALVWLKVTLDEPGHDPDDIWLMSGWAVLLTLLAILCLANLLLAQRDAGRLRIGANAAAVLLAVAGLLSGDADLQGIGGVSALPFLVTLAARAASRDGESA